MQDLGHQPYQQSSFSLYKCNEVKVAAQPDHKSAGTVSCCFGITSRPVLGANENTGEETRWNVRTGDHLGPGRQGFGNHQLFHFDLRLQGRFTCTRGRGWDQNLCCWMERRLHDPDGDGRESELQNQSSNIGALTSRIGFWGILYYNQKKEPQNSAKGLVIF